MEPDCSDVFNALSRTRLFSADGKTWDSDQVSIVAATMRNGSTPTGLFQNSIAQHRQLFPSAGLRVAGDPSKGRYQSASVLAEIGLASMTAVAPIAFMELLHSGSLAGATGNVPSIFAKYDSVSAEAKLLTMAVERPEDCVQLLVRCLPYLDVKRLIEGEPNPSGSPQKTDYCLFSCIPLEVGGFHNAIAAAVHLVYGFNKRPTEKTQQVDLLVSMVDHNADAPHYAIEVVVGSCRSESQSAVVTRIVEHHARWAVGGQYSSYSDPVNPHHCVTIAFVEPKGFELDRALIEEIETAQRGACSGVPLLLVRFSNGAYELECHLFGYSSAHNPCSFMLDVDGVAMKLVISNVGEPQLLPAQAFVERNNAALRKWMTRYRSPESVKFHYVIGSDGMSIALDSRFLTVETAVHEINEKLARSGEQVASIYLPDAFGRIKSEAAAWHEDLPLTSCDCRARVEVKPSING